MCESLLLKLKVQSIEMFLKVETANHLQRFIFRSITIIFYIHSSYGVEVFIFLWIYKKSVGLLGRVIGPSQGLYLNTGKHKHRKKHTHTHRTSMPEVEFGPTNTASERAELVHASERSTIVTG
jgi:hypothetical protein